MLRRKKEAVGVTSERSPAPRHRRFLYCEIHHRKKKDGGKKALTKTASSLYISRRGGREREN